LQRKMEAQYLNTDAWKAGQLRRVGQAVWVLGQVVVHNAVVVASTQLPASANFT
jgi:hypothetical protein